MRKLASIGLAVGALAFASLPVRADDQSIGFATGALDGTARAVPANNQQGRPAPTQQSFIRHGAPPPRIGAEAYQGYAFYGQKSCGYVGGPKNGTWTCQ